MTPTEQHSITPPPELLKQWEDDWFEEREHADVLLIQAFQSGADQELEACCTVLDGLYYRETINGNQLRAARRPQPPTLKKQSLALIDLIQGAKKAWDISDLNVIRRALEALPDD